MTNQTPAPHAHHAAAPAPGGGRGWKIGFIILAVVLGLAVVGAVIWGVVAATSTPAPSPTPTATPTPTPSPTETPTPTPTPDALASCTADQLDVTLGQAEGAAGTTQVPLVFTNTGDPCTIQGYPQVAFVGDDNGTQLGAAATPDDSSGTVNSYDLATGDTVMAPLSIATAANFENCTVQAANGFRVYPPTDSGAIFVPSTDYEACTNSDVELLKVGAVTQN